MRMQKLIDAVNELLVARGNDPLEPNEIKYLQDVGSEVPSSPAADDGPPDPGTGQP